MVLNYSQLKDLQSLLTERTEGLDHETSVAVVNQLLGYMEASSGTSRQLEDLKKEKKRSDVARGVNRPI